MARRDSKSGAAVGPVCTYVEGERLALHRGTGQSYFLLPDSSGAKKRYFMGAYYDAARWGTPSAATLTRAATWIREYRVIGGPPPKEGEHRMTLSDLVTRFLKHARDYFGESNAEVGHFEIVVGVAVEMYGTAPAERFGPLALKAVRERMVSSDRFNRKTVNGYVQRLRRMFKWAASNELLPASVFEALRTVDGLRHGKTTAREPGRVRPAPTNDVAAVLPHVSRQVRAMIELQRLTGMRPGEVVVMRPTDIDRSAAVWTYRPAQHKTLHLDHARDVAIGPRGQLLLAPFLLGRAADAYVFSPAEAEQDRLQALHAARKTPMSCGNVPGSHRVRSPERTKGDRYTTTAYRRAVARACVKANVSNWHPHQLRHTAATEFRRRFGIEAARVALGHSDAGVTLIYAEADQEMARKIAAEVG